MKPEIIRPQKQRRSRRPLWITFFNIVLVLIVIVLVKAYYHFTTIEVVRVDDVQYRLMVANKRLFSTFSLLAQNLSDEPQTFISQQGRFYEIEIFRGDQDKKRLWHWSKDKFFLNRDATITLAPGESREFKENWNHLNDGGKAVGSGLYVVKWRLLYLPDEPAISLKFKIKI